MSTKYANRKWTGNAPQMDWGNEAQGDRTYRSGQLWRVTNDGKMYRLRGRFRRVGRKRAIWTRRGIKWRTPIRGRVIRGRGSYAWAVPYAGAAVGGAMKGVGSYMGGTLGGAVGALGGGISRISGAGSYRNISNSMIAEDGSQVPYMHSADETVRIRHREYLGDLVTSSTPGEFKIQKFKINPGLDSVFPWGSQIAQAFTEYTMLGLVCTVKSNSADALNSTNTNLGTVIMSTNYNVNSPEFTGKSDMLNSMWAVTGKQSESMMLPIECDLSQMVYNNHYIRGSEVDADRNMYDHCDIFIATEGGQGASVNIGEIWLSYDIELRKPRANGVIGRYLDSALFSTSSSGAYSTGPFENATEVTDNIGIALTNRTITGEAGTAGKYLISFWMGGATGVVAAPVITYDNCVGVPINGTSESYSGAVGSVDAYTITICIEVQSSSEEWTVNYAAGTFQGKTIGGLIITQVADNMET